MGGIEPEGPARTLQQIVRLLKGHPYLLYGLGSVLALAAVVGTAATTGASLLVAVLASLLLLAALGVAALRTKRKATMARRDVVASVKVKRNLNASGGTLGSNRITDGRSASASAKVAADNVDVHGNAVVGSNVIGSDGSDHRA